MGNLIKGTGILLIGILIGALVSSSPEVDDGPVATLPAPTCEPVEQQPTENSCEAEEQLRVEQLTTLRDKDSEGFDLCADFAFIVSDMQQAIADLDVDEYSRLSDQIGPLAEEMTTIAEERQELLNEYGVGY